MLHIPEDKLPKEYKDEARLDSLFSPFRSRSVNPRDWETKISSWKQLISLYCVNNGVYSFSLSKLKKLFIRQGRPPSCLSTVLEELVKSGELQHFDDFIKQSPTSWGGWATDLLVKKPLSWSYKTVRRSIFSNQINPEQIYVHIEVIEGESQKLFAVIPGKHRNKVITFAEFLTLIDRDLSQAEDVKLLLHYLSKEKKADVRNLKDNADEESTLVKIGAKEQVAHISDDDIAIFLLEQNERIFTKHVEELEDEIARCVKEAKGHLVKGHRQLAKTCLRKKQEIQKRLTNKTSALNNVQVLLERIKDVHSNAEVLHSYKQALSAFNSKVKETGLTEDAVEDTMVQLGEMLDVHDDIQTALSKPALDSDEDLEDELAELMKTDEPSDSNTSTELEDQMAKLDLGNLPKIPSANVSVQEAS